MTAAAPCRDAPGSPAGPKNQVLYTLQAYRGLAAVLVLLFHVNLLTTKAFRPSAIGSLFHFGHAGVQFFFVLSGFIIFFIHEKDCGRWERIRPYLQKRFIRVYPIYWITTLAFLPVFLLVPGFGKPYHRELGSLILSLLLIPQTHLPHLSVAWTLCHEVLFYLLFIGALLHKRTGLGVMCLWFLSIIAAQCWWHGALPYPASFFFSLNNLLFGLGILAANLCKLRLPRSLGVVMFLLGNAMFLTAGAFENRLGGTVEYLLPYGIAAFFIVLGGVMEPVNQMFKNRRALLFLGDASYAVYLIHFYLLSFACKIVVGLHLIDKVPLFVCFFLIAATGLAGGLLYRVTVEAPFLRFAHSGFSRESISAIWRRSEKKSH